MKKLFILFISIVALFISCDIGANKTAKTAEEVKTYPESEYTIDADGKLVVIDSTTEGEVVAKVRTNKEGILEVKVLKDIPAGSFQDLHISSIVFNKDIKEIGAGSFKGSTIKHIKMSETTTVDADAFDNNFDESIIEYYKN